MTLSYYNLPAGKAASCRSKVVNMKYVLYIWFGWIRFIALPDVAEHQLSEFHYSQPHQTHKGMGKYV